jgi:uncharacterized membrane protein
VSPDPTSSTGLPPRLAATLAYSGWWITGLVFWLVEERDAYVRFHAAQALVVFGAVAGAVALLATAAAASLVLMPEAFGFWAWLAAIGWAGGLVLWLCALWNAAAGRAWRIPIAAPLVDRVWRA